ncbi:MAG: hypothetical protein AB8F78_02365 [Saprospiraceae bacterium]
MKMITRLLLLVVLLGGAPTITPSSFAISSVKVEPSTADLHARKSPKAQKLKKRRKRRVRQSRSRLSTSYGPKKLFVGGLLTAAVGIALLLASKNDQPEGFEGIIGAIILRLGATLAVIGGGVMALIGGIWWIFE